VQERGEKLVKCLDFNEILWEHTSFFCGSKDIWHASFGVSMNELWLKRGGRVSCELVLRAVASRAYRSLVVRLLNLILGMYVEKVNIFL